MQKSDLNEFTKYQGLSTYKPKTQVRIIEMRNPLQYYQQNKIETQNWDESLLQTKQPINKELDRINNLVETLIIGRDNQKKEEIQILELNQSKIREVNEQVQEDLEILEQRNNQKIQELANIKNELLNIQCEYMNRQQLRLEFNEHQQNKEEKIKVKEEEILKAIKILQN
ncbi:unnamed protein product [Paramecium sonneborni]|uniref:Uncharacterized protein n=1 Tax=Paramecium sonneborni TaxID=65129 RepID=A0A8S1RKU2_9CILI|nr:unnamed protein product [Paramecium sonneborni]